jgi:phosphoglycerate kinase
MTLNSIKSVKNLKGKKILYRVAYDISLVQKGKSWVVPDNARITATLPTIKYLLDKGASIVFLSWLKRPDGEVVEKYRMDPVARELASLLQKPVVKIDQCIGDEVKEEIKNLKPGQLLMLENVRFYKEEMSGDKNFAKELTTGLDLIVYDAFAQGHRDAPSVTGIMKYLPSYAGLLLESEVKNLSKIIDKPKKPLTIILGGAKLSDKINVLKSLIKKADYVLIGGGLANIFLQAQNIAIGKSYIETAGVEKHQEHNYFINEAKKILKNKNIILPVDMLSAGSLDKIAKIEVVDLEKGEKIKDGWMFVDIGPKTMKKFDTIIKSSKTVLWNGPMGVFEVNQFAKGTKSAANAIVKSKAVSVVGGGDTEIIVKKYKLEGKFTHVSTGGGAMLSFLEGKMMPAIKCLIKK